MLTASFDMGWNKHTSGHKYDSLSGHAFISGVYNRRIIGFVVFSKTCSICNARYRKNKAEDKVINVNNCTSTSESESDNKNEEHVPIDDTVASHNGNSLNNNNSTATCFNGNSATIDDNGASISNLNGNRLTGTAACSKGNSASIHSNLKNTSSTGRATVLV